MLAPPFSLSYILLTFLGPWLPSFLKHAIHHSDPSSKGLFLLALVKAKICFCFLSLFFFSAGLKPYVAENHLEPLNSFLYFSRIIT